jgi:hypothetical protein
MVISHTFKTIWMFPQQTGEEVTTDFLKKYGFETYNVDDYLDYHLICNIRNPYDRIISLYFQKHFNNKLIKKELTSVYKKMFNDWVDSAFIPNKLMVSVANLPKFTISGVNQLEKWTFSDKIPNSFVRLENYDDDIRKIDFINEKFIDLSQINLQEQRTFKFNEMYSAESAKKIYHFFKKHFYLCGYDPFSFTKEKLTDEEKISFIHNIL